MKKGQLFFYLFLLILLTSCQKTTTQTTSKPTTTDKPTLANLPLNFTNTNQNGVYYQIFVRSFADSDGNGVGDFRGIANNIDYLKELGIKGIWLMPMLEAGSYHGYDVIDYFSVEKDYGTLDDFIYLINTCKASNIQLIIDLVVNHTSDQHPWFRSSKSNRSGEYGDYYVWIPSTDPRKNLKGSWDQTIWHSYSGNYYAGYFTNSMPDLNMMNEEVQEKIIEIGDFWLDKGVDGFRLDAAMHMFGKNEYPANVDYKSENVIWWHNFRTELQKEHPDVFLIGEIWDTPGVIAPYFKGLHSAFNFELSDKILHAVSSNSGSGYTSSINYMYNQYAKQHPNFIDAPFLTNHDEDRVASVLTSMEDLKMASEMLLMLPGIPFIYYGEETGMKGVKGGTNVWDITRRLPLKWSSTTDPRNTTWYSNAINASVPSIKEQQDDPNSLLNHYKKLIQVRNANAALTNGNFSVYNTNATNIISFVRSTDDQTVLVLHNPTVNDITLNLNQNDFSKIIYQSNPNNSYTFIKSNSSLVLEVKPSATRHYID